MAKKEDRLAFGAKKPLRVKKWLRSGEFTPACIETVADIYEEAIQLLASSHAHDICGECVFQGEDGQWYVGAVEFRISKINPVT